MKTMIPYCLVTPTDVLNLLKSGILSCVLKQDWSVNRIAPDFLNASEFRKSLACSKKLLHLGIGNGECYKYFESSNITQMSVSDKLYFDPVEVIKIFFNKCGISDNQSIELAEIMRNEFLIAISLESLLEFNKDCFSEKDKYIIDILKRKYDDSKSYSYNVLELLISLLNHEPQLLVPISICEQRIVTPMGKRIETRQISNIEYADVILKLNKKISLKDVTAYLSDRFHKINDVRVMDFMSLEFDNDIKFDYILASRSDAFLQNDYYRFLEIIIKYLKNDGFYISDGIVSSYNYEIFYKDLISTVGNIGEKRVFLIRSFTSPKSLPLREIVGIIATGINSNICNVHKFIDPKRIIPFHDVLYCNEFKRQCAWSDLIKWANANNVDLESIEFKTITKTLDEYVRDKDKGIILSTSDIGRTLLEIIHNKEMLI
jgi:hypothetical protein